MSEATAARLLRAALTQAGWPPDAQCDPVRHVLPFSGVWRLRQPGGGTAIYKEAWHPLDNEHTALRYARSKGLPVPQVLAAVRQDGRLGMIMTDLGLPDREATDRDAATIAAALHRIPVDRVLPVTGPAELAAMPAQIAASARKHGLPALVAALAARLEAIAISSASAAATPPVGLCHSEFHPESVIVRQGHWHTYDLARAFHGPGLIDIASWHGTVSAPDPQATAGLIDAYVSAGGHRSALELRDGRPPENWALGWHRIWTCNWYCQQLDLGWVPVGSLPVYGEVITRHLTEAATLLNA
jgi:hypothetical protein